MTYLWVFGRNSQQQDALSGPYNSSDDVNNDARLQGWSGLKTFALNTNNRQQAWDIITRQYMAQRPAVSNQPYNQQPIKAPVVKNKESDDDDDNEVWVSDWA